MGVAGAGGLSVMCERILSKNASVLTLCDAKARAASAHGCSNKALGHEIPAADVFHCGLSAAASAATRTPHSRRALREDSMQAAAPPPASDPASTKKQRRAARDERTSIGNLSDADEEDALSSLN